MSKLRFFNIFFQKPGLTKTFYLMKDFQFSLEGTVCFMLENFKKKFMIWVVSVLHFVPYLVGFVWSWAFQKCPNFECPSTFKLPSQLSSCAIFCVLGHNSYRCVIISYQVRLLRLGWKLVFNLLRTEKGDIFSLRGIFSVLKNAGEAE